MQATVTKRFSIEAAHYLPGYPGKCANLHGHRWEISVSVTGPVSLNTGFVMDFSDLKRLVVKPLEDQFDHKCLNNCHPFTEMRPTAENLAEYILAFSISKLAPVLGVWVSSVTVAETPDNIATVRTD